MTKENFLLQLNDAKSLDKVANKVLDYKMSFDSHYHDYSQAVSDSNLLELLELVKEAKLFKKIDIFKLVTSFEIGYIFYNNIYQGSPLRPE
jgi:hypothetical protein